MKQCGIAADALCPTADHNALFHKTCSSAYCSLTQQRQTQLNQALAYTAVGMQAKATGPSNVLRQLTYLTHTTQIIAQQVHNHQILSLIFLRVCQSHGSRPVLLRIS